MVYSMLPAWSCGSEPLLSPWELGCWVWSCWGTCGVSSAKSAWRRDLACRCRGGMRLLFALFSRICFALLGGKLIIKAWENIAREKNPIRLETSKPAVATGLSKDHRLESCVHNSEPEQLLNQLFPWQITLPLEAGGHKEKGNWSSDFGNNGLDPPLIWPPSAEAEGLCSFLSSEDLWTAGGAGEGGLKARGCGLKGNLEKGEYCILLMGLCQVKHYLPQQVSVLCWTAAASQSLILAVKSEWILTSGLTNYACISLWKLPHLETKSELLYTKNPFTRHQSKSQCIAVKVGCGHVAYIL